MWVKKECEKYTNSEFLRVKRQFLPIHPGLAGAKVATNNQGAKGRETKVSKKVGETGGFPNKIRLRCRRPCHCRQAKSMLGTRCVCHPVIPTCRELYAGKVRFLPAVVWTGVYNRASPCSFLINCLSVTVNCRSMINFKQKSCLSSRYCCVRIIFVS